MLWSFIRVKLIGEKLLVIALEFAQEYTHIGLEQLCIIKNCLKSILLEGSDCRVKKKNTAFDVTMGSYDGADAYELVGIFLLD